jgi:hypothetical protein
MYLFETGLGQAFKPRDQKKTPPPKQPPPPLRKVPPKATPKGPPDGFLELYTHWDLWVPFRKNFMAFGQAVAKAIGRHVNPSEKTTIDSLLKGSQGQLKPIHDAYAPLATESNFVHIRTSLRFKKINHTGLDWLFVERGLALKDSIK